MSYGRPAPDYNIVVDVDDDEPTLEFQDFASTNAQRGRMNSNGQTAGPAAAAAAAPPYQPPGSAEAPTGG
ncbi:hypothetical protein GGH95_006665, partial [Coemansia sp. RSA 1836]